MIDNAHTNCNTVCVWERSEWHSWHSCMRDPRNWGVCSSLSFFKFGFSSNTSTRHSSNNLGNGSMARIDESWKCYIQVWWQSSCRSSWLHFMDTASCLFSTSQRLWMHAVEADCLLPTTPWCLGWVSCEVWGIRPMGASIFAEPPWFGGGDKFVWSFVCVWPAVVRAANISDSLERSMYATACSPVIFRTLVMKKIQSEHCTSCMWGIQCKHCTCSRRTWTSYIGELYSVISRTVFLIFSQLWFSSLFMIGSATIGWNVHKRAYAVACMLVVESG